MKYYVVEFYRSDAKFFSIFGTGKLFASINIELEEVELLNEGPIKDPELGYVFKKKNSNKKDFFRARHKYLGHTTML